MTTTGANNASDQAFDPDLDRWLVPRDYRNPPRDTQFMQNYIRNLNSIGIELPPMYSSYESFDEYMDNLYRLERRIEVLYQMSSSLRHMCPDLSETRNECHKDLKEAEKEYDTLYNEVMRQIKSVPVEMRRRAMRDYEVRISGPHNYVGMIAE